MTNARKSFTRKKKGVEKKTALRAFLYMVRGQYFIDNQKNYKTSCIARTDNMDK